MNAKFMDEALLEAEKALKKSEVPVGAVVVKNGKIVGRGHNLRETEGNALLHAETAAIADACRNIGTWKLDGCSIYITLEPCPMCAGAIIMSRLSEVVFGAADKNAGAAGSVCNLFSFPFPSTPEVFGGVREEKCAEILKSFFKKLR